MRPPAFKVVGITGSKNPPLALDCDLQASAQDNATFFALMHQRNLAGIGAGLIALLQDLKGTTEQVIPDLSIRDLPLPDLDQLI
jgi:hypothetical protein